MSKSSPINFDPMYNLLEAEYATICCNKNDLSERLYLSAIENFSQLGRTQYEAMAWERFALRDIKRGSQDAGNEKLRKAYELYSKWGKLFL